MKKIFILVLCLVLCVGCSMAYAIEEGGESTEPTESTSEPTEGDSGDGELETVNISEESIEQIAYAVAAVSSDYTYSYQYEINTDDGATLIIDTNIANLLTDYEVLVVSASSSKYQIYFEYGNVSVFSGDYYYVDGYRTKYVHATDSVIVFESFNDSDNIVSASQIDITTIVWANSHVYDVNGNLLYTSSYEEPVTFQISFVTGFDDYIIESTTSDVFSLPDANYEGYTFLGWYEDSEFTTPFVYSEGYEFISDLTLYAKWSEKSEMSVFITSVLNSFSALFECDPVRYIIGLIGFAVVCGMIKILIGTRV